MMKERYKKNMSSFSLEELELILHKKVCVVGCGGLGGHVLQSLVRFGIGAVTLVDGDVFCESNLNRQVFSTEENLGQNKAEAAALALALINSDVRINICADMLNEENAVSILSGHDLIFDCLDNIPARFLLMQECRKLSIPFVHGAIGGFFGQVACIFPGDRTLEQLYSGPGSGIEQSWGNPSFTPQLVAAIQCSEGLKILAGRPCDLQHKFLRVDLLNNEMDCIPLREGNV